MKVRNPFKINRILTELGMKSKLAYLMRVTLLVVGHGLVSQDERKHGGGMTRLTVSSRKKDDSGKSSRKVGI